MPRHWLALGTLFAAIVGFAVLQMAMLHYGAVARWGERPRAWPGDVQSTMTTTIADPNENKQEDAEEDDTISLPESVENLNAIIEKMERRKAYLRDHETLPSDPDRTFLGRFDTFTNAWLTNRRRDPGTIKALSLEYPSSGVCNELSLLAMGMTFAKRFGLPIALSHKWANFTVENLDLELLAKSEGYEFIFPHGFPIPRAFSDKPVERVSPQQVEPLSSDFLTWCAQKLSLPAFAEALRPNKAIRAHGRRAIAELRTRGARRVVSVHVRNFEGRSEFESEYYSGSTCHYEGRLPKAVYSAVRDYKLDDTMLIRLKHEYPELSSEWWSSIGIFLSTDSQNEERVDSTYLNSAGWSPAVRAAVVAVTKARFSGARKRLDTGAAESRLEEHSMLRDIWTSVLADLYIAHPMSSCDGIVAQWRRAVRPSSLTPFPRSCFEFHGVWNAPLAPPPETICRHVNQFFLDAPPYSLKRDSCRMLLVLASALTKAIENARVEARPADFKLYGAWRALVEEHLEYGPLDRYLMRRGVRLVLMAPEGVKKIEEQTGPRLRRYKSGTFALFFYHAAINSTMEVECAKGSSFDVVREAYRFKMPLDAHGGGGGGATHPAESFCCRGTAGQEAHEAGAFATACDQLKAHFRTVPNPRDGQIDGAKWEQCLACFARSDPSTPAYVYRTNDESRFVCGK